MIWSCPPQPNSIQPPAFQSIQPLNEPGMQAAQTNLPIDGLHTLAISRQGARHTRKCLRSGKERIPSAMPNLEFVWHN